MILIFASPELAAQWLQCPGLASSSQLPSIATVCHPLPAVTLPHFAGKSHWTSDCSTGYRSSGLGLQSSSRKLENWKQKYFSLNNSAIVCSQLFVLCRL